MKGLEDRSRTWPSNGSLGSIFCLDSWLLGNTETYYVVADLTSQACNQCPCQNAPSRKMPRNWLVSWKSCWGKKRPEVLSQTIYRWPFCPSSLEAFSGRTDFVRTQLQMEIPMQAFFVSPNDYFSYLLHIISLSCTSMLLCSSIHSLKPECVAQPLLYFSCEEFDNKI